MNDGSVAGGDCIAVGSDLSTPNRVMSMWQLEGILFNKL